MTGTRPPTRPPPAAPRLVQLVCGVWTTWTLLALVLAPAAAADNCSAFSDCFGVANSAAEAAFGLALLAVLSLVLDFVPVVGTVKGAIEALSRRDLITGEELAPWERALGVIPYVGKLGRVSKVIGTVDDVGKHLDDVGDVSKRLDDVGDVSKHADDVGDLGKHVGETDATCGIARYHPKTGVPYDDQGSRSSTGFVNQR